MQHILAIFGLTVHAWLNPVLDLKEGVCYYNNAAQYSQPYNAGQHYIRVKSKLYSSFFDEGPGCSPNTIGTRVWYMNEVSDSEILQLKRKPFIEVPCPDSLTKAIGWPVGFGK